MAFIDDLVKAGTFLNQNVAQLQMNRTIAGANDAVQQIKAAEGDEQQKRAQLQQLSQALTMDLARFGAPADTIQMIAQQVSPNRFFQTPDQVLINPEMSSTEQKGAAKKIMDDEMGLKRELKQIQLDDRAELRQEKVTQRVQDKLLKAGEHFTTVAKKNIESLDASQSMLDMLAAGGPVTDQAITGLAARASGEVGALTEADKEPYGGSQAMISKLHRFAKKAANGRLPDSDRAELTRLAVVFNNAAKRNLQNKARLKAEQTAKVLGLSPDEVFEKILPTNALFEDQLMGTSKKAAPGSSATGTNYVPVRVKDKSGNLVEALKDPTTGKLFRKK